MEDQAWREFDGVAVKIFARPVAHLVFCVPGQRIPDIPDGACFPLRHGEGQIERKTIFRYLVGLVVFVPPVVWEHRGFDAWQVLILIA